MRKIYKAEKVKETMKVIRIPPSRIVTVNVLVHLHFVKFLTYSVYECFWAVTSTWNKETTENFKQV